MKSQIILASSSPRRIEMMKKNGIEPIIIPSSADETLPMELSMEQAVMFLALKKALYVEKQWMNESNDERISSVIIAADTVVYKNGIIGKPVDRTDAKKTLMLLRNTNHFVATGVALIGPGFPKRSVLCDVTEVIFKDYTENEVDRYLDTEEPWDKAGSYAIQGTWSKHISHIVGNYNNVIGFPWEKIQSELQKNWTEIHY